jgi:integrase
MLSLQNSGFHTSADITEDAVLSALTDDSGYPVKSASYCDQITAVFKKLAEQYDESVRILQYLPKVRKHRENVQYLTPDERAKIKSALKDTSNKLSLRDRAIGHLLYFTGLRCSDISNLKFSDVDLGKDEISVCQQKTGIPLKLPMSAIVGNSIYDYVKDYRRESNSPYIFLSETIPHGKLKPGSIGVIAGQIYDNAEIRINSGDRRGGHLFRHNFATAMLENGISRAVISKTMGHDSPTSVEPYLSADMVHLKECSLSIEEFPVRKGVFINEE